MSSMFPPMKRVVSLKGALCRSTLVFSTKRNFGPSLTKWNRTIDEVNQAIMDNDQDYNLHIEKARILTKHGKFTESLDSFIIAMNLPSMPANYQGFLPEIFTCAEKACKENPSNFTGLLFYGTSLEQQNKLNEAIDQYEKAILVSAHDADMVQRLSDRIEALKRKIESKSEQSLF